MRARVREVPRHSFHHTASDGIVLCAREDVRAPVGHELPAYR